MRNLKKENVFCGCALALLAAYWIFVDPNEARVMAAVREQTCVEFAKRHPEGAIVEWTDTYAADTKLFRCFILEARDEDCLFVSFDVGHSMREFASQEEVCCLKLGDPVKFELTGDPKSPVRLVRVKK